MSRTDRSFALLALAGASATAQVAPPPATTAATTSATTAIDAAFTRWARERPVPGLVWGVVSGGRLTHVGRHGVQTVEGRVPVDADTRFRIASMTKAFTALAILQLRDAGKLQLDAPAARYVPELAGWRYPTSDARPMTVRDLLSHVGGLVTDDPWGDRQQVLSDAEFTRMLAAGVPFSRTPGTQMEYSNFGYALLGRIVTNASGMPYRRYVERMILAPLGMTSSGFDAPAAPPAHYAIGYRWEDDAWRREPEMRDGAFNAMGGLQVSANDYARWVAFLLSAWPARDGPEAGPVRRSTVRELAEGLNFVRIAGRARADGQPCPQTDAYGKGMRVVQDCELGLTLGHGGGYPGYGSYVLLLPEAGVGVFAMANRTYAAPSDAVWGAALALDRAGALTWQTTAATPAVTAMHEAVRRAYAASDLAPLDGRLAMNFLLDSDRAHWARNLAGLKAQLGSCDRAGPLAPTGRLSTAFRWTCAKGTLDGTILLAPTDPPGLQALRFRPRPD